MNEMAYVYIYNIKNCLDLSGRLTRRQYWSFLLVHFFLVAVVLGFAHRTPFLYYVAYVYLVLMLIPSFTATVKRLHDVGKSVKWMLWFLLPVPGVLIVFLYIIGEGESIKNAYGYRLDFSFETE
ncbi:DUF805 domain-containing protein [Hornefia butyriciproducens]|uniref:DUF805 domain-containing protein n=1 Tax=Hornefia butyriciproducens TaxID=2652293 RepID=UPI002A9176A9|nr:DUF805 domain-containing protein [Hornefia butyriciproducens]MCI7412563.1 DUF805 domain-containing protein [Clostridiales bacterium]MDY6211901.1 DUF805 domain-containing protein [Hornefia butyriciproducens]